MNRYGASLLLSNLVPCLPSDTKDFVNLTSLVNHKHLIFRHRLASVKKVYYSGTDYYGLFIVVHTLQSQRQVNTD